MTLRYKICLFAVKLFEDHGIKVDHAELLSLKYMYVVEKVIGHIPFVLKGGLSAVTVHSCQINMSR